MGKTKFKGQRAGIATLGFGGRVAGNRVGRGLGGSPGGRLGFGAEIGASGGMQLSATLGFAVAGLGGASTSAGDLILTADAAGLKTCASYDSLHRVVRKGLSSGDVDTFAWDASGASNKGIGRLASAANSAATDSFTWTAVGQPATVTEEVSGLGTYTSRYSYDQTGQQTQSVGPTGFTMNAAYDLEARLASISNPAGGYFLANRSFSPGGQVLGQSLGVNGSSTALAE